MFAAVILTAGRSRRAGVFKPAHVHRGRPLLLHAIAGLQRWRAPVLVVTGFRHALIAGMLAGRPGVVTVRNPNPEHGMFSSVRTGVAALPDALTGFFVLPADCPFVAPRTHAALLAAFARHGSARPVIPVHAGRGGHPVLLPASARQTILAAPPGATLRAVLGDLAPERLPVDDPAVLTDLDTPADLRRLR